MTKEEFEQLKSTVKQWLFHTGSLDPTNYANELKLKFIEPREKRIAELENKLTEKVTLESLDVVSGKIKQLEQENAELNQKVIDLENDREIFLSDFYCDKKGTCKLTKAKEIIKAFLDSSDLNIKHKAEEFLGEF